MGCRVHGEAKVWLQQNQKHHQTWEKRWKNFGVTTGIGGAAVSAGATIAAIMALPAVLLTALTAFLFVANVGSFAFGVNWLLSRKGKSLVEKAIQAVLEENDCTKAERMFEAAKKLAQRI